MIFHIILRKYRIVIITISTINNIKFRFKVNISFVNLLIIYRIVQKEIIIKVLNFIIKAITFITLIDYLFYK